MSPRSLGADSEKSINNILDYVGGEGKGYGVETNLATLEKFYEVTKKNLEEAKNEVRPPRLRCTPSTTEFRRLTLLNILVSVWWCVLQRLSVKANLKLAKLWLDRKEWDRLRLVRLLPVTRLNIFLAAQLADLFCRGLCRFWTSCTLSASRPSRVPERRVRTRARAPSVSPLSLPGIARGTFEPKTDRCMVVVADSA